jgi:hypothetical protein
MCINVDWIIQREVCVQIYEMLKLKKNSFLHRIFCAMYIFEYPRLFVSLSYNCVTLKNIIELCLQHYVVVTDIDKNDVSIRHPLLGLQSDRRLFCVGLKISYSDTGFDVILTFDKIPFSGIAQYQSNLIFL